MGTPANYKFHNDRRPTPGRDGDDSIGLDKRAVTEANQHILDSTPVYRHDEVNRKIKTTAVQRFRKRAAGEGDFESIDQYKQFICGTND